MNRKVVLSILLICAFALSIGCSSLTREGRASRKAAEIKLAEEAKRAAEQRPKMSGKWEKIDTDLRNVEYYYDKESISFPSDNLIHVWRRKVFPVNSPHKEIISFEEINCRTEKYRSLQSQSIGWDGTPSEMFIVTAPWATIFQLSPEEYFLDNYCTPEKRLQAKEKK